MALYVDKYGYDSYYVVYKFYDVLISLCSEETDMKLNPGIYCAQLVPYDEKGRVKEKPLEAMVRRNIVLNGVDGLYIGGSTGEAFLADSEARKRTLEISADAARSGGRKVSLIAQVGSLNIKEAEELARLASSLGYDAVSAVTPYYYKFTFEETKEYYTRLASAAGLPMLVYSVPALTGTSFDIRQSAELYSNPLVAGFKYTSGDLYTMERLISAFPERLVFSGYDELLMLGRALGAYGAIGSTYNLFAPLAKSIWKLMGEGKVSEARAAQSCLNGAIQELAALGLYQALKEIISMNGIDAGSCLPPFAPLSEAKKAKARQLCERMAALGYCLRG